ncbi:MAG: acyl-CoA dehydrogenase [Hyphomicrobiales bacterium]|nr:MAG: acyl-CoA dehydrogenase [Hyphomicrobiales bacterium]
MSEFSAPVEDIIFSLEFVADAGRIDGWDADLVREIVQHFAGFAQGEIAPVDEAADLEGCRVVDGKVIVPEGFKVAYQQYVEQGWNGLSIPEKYDGQDLPAPVLGAVSEIFTGACHSLQMIVGLIPGAVRVLKNFGSEAQRDLYIPLLASGDWLATMCMTEAGAGSDLSGIRTKAVEVDGVWRISGEKIFISGGGQDISPHILHLVLARTGGLDEGVRGLSLFLCRSHLADGVENAVKVDRIEEKMGLHGSPTCQLSFDAAEAELIGELGQGLKAMFTLMNHARLDVGLQGVAHAARAGDIAQAYAAERVQGRLVGGKDQVVIEQHHDVKNMLNEQQALAIGGRAMCHITLVLLETGENADLVDFLTPICKVFCSEAGIKSADMGIQILGGYGYLHEYRVEQVLRDARITSIYEGTNSIHALGLATRLLRHKNGAAARAFEQMILDVGSDELMVSLSLWRDMRDRVLAKPELANAFMKLTGLLTYQAVWVKILAVADKSLDAERLRKLADHVFSTVPRDAKYWSTY